MGMDARYEVRVARAEEVAAWCASSRERECDYDPDHGEVGRAREPHC